MLLLWCVCVGFLILFLFVCYVCGFCFLFCVCVHILFHLKLLYYTVEFQCSQVEFYILTDFVKTY